MAGVSRLVETQVAMWKIKSLLEDVNQRPGRRLIHNVAYGPCLLISRERGSGGSQIARLAGERLGWHVFDREIVDQIARHAQVRKQLIESVDERIRLAMHGVDPPELKPEDIGCETFLVYLRQVVMTLGYQGDVVILGRGAPHLLPPACALRVRVVAPRELRAKRMAERASVSLEEAYEGIQQFDAERTTFMQRSFQRDPASPLNYDLTINTGELNYEMGARIVLAALWEKLGVRPEK